MKSTRANAIKSTGKSHARFGWSLNKSPPLLFLTEEDLTDRAATFFVFFFAMYSLWGKKNHLSRDQIFGKISAIKFY